MPELARIAVPPRSARLLCLRGDGERRLVLVEVTQCECFVDLEQELKICQRGIGAE